MLGPCVIALVDTDQYALRIVDTARTYLNRIRNKVNTKHLEAGITMLSIFFQGGLDVETIAVDRRLSALQKCLNSENSDEKCHAC